MPYSRRSGGWELSRSIGHVPLIQSEFVQERLRDFRAFTSGSDPVAPDLIVPATTLASPAATIRWLLSFDGSQQEVPVREAYPSTRIGYVQVAGVLIHLDEMLGQTRQSLVDPAVIRSVISEALHSIVLPGSNVCRPDMRTVRDSWRAEIFEIFSHYAVEDVSLFDTFKLLIDFSDKRSRSGGVLLTRCSASDTCAARDIDVPLEGTDCVSCGQRLFPTDALRIHEEVSEEHSNATSLGRLMAVLEQITMVAYLNFLLQRQPRVLGYVGFIMDGPLALFGPQAWLHTAILAFLHALERSLVQQNFRHPVIVGIEKGGQFAEHAAAIAQYIPRGSLMLLPDQYIYQHILTFRLAPNSSFGRDTYYGQKFFYKTQQGQLLTLTVPKTSSTVTDPHRPSHYPVLSDAVALLDRIGTSLYEDAVIPVALAHSFASIPLRTGSKVLTLLSRDLLAL